MIRVLVLMLVIPCLLSAQDFFDEMEIIDISNKADVKTSIVRDPEQALLIVKTQIPGIRVESNNVIIRKKQVENGVWHIFLKPGTHRIVFQAEGFISVKQRISFNAKDVKGRQLNVVPVDADADKNSGKLVISSNPPEAMVYINGDFYGFTPYLGKLIQGNYQLELRKDSYITFTKTIIILPGATYPLNVDIVPQTSVEISSFPRNAEIYLDGEKIENAPVTVEGLHFGKHTIKAILDGYVDKTQEFEIKTSSDKLNLNVTLSEKASTLSLNGTPRGALVFINGRKAGTLPLKDEKLFFGRYSVEIRNDGYLTFTKDIEINDIEPYVETIQLKPKSRNTALFYSTFLPGSGQYYLDQEAKGLLIGAATVGSALAAIIFNANYSDDEKAYFNNKEVYEANFQLSEMTTLYNKVTKSYNKMENTATSVKVFGIIAGVLWAYNIADLFIFAPQQKKVAVNMISEPGRTSLSLNINF